MTFISGSTLDIDNLYSLARDRSAKGRAALARRMVDLFANKDENLSDREQALMSDILSQLISDMEVSVRRSLSEKLCRDPDAPRDLIFLLANDNENVARPILLNSKLLDDSELIRIVRNRALEHQLAIALRTTVSKKVSAALVKTGEESVITNLLRNAGAQLSTATTEYLVEESRRVDSFREPLVTRPELSRPLAKKMCLWVSAALREYILKKFSIRALEIDELLEEAVDTIVAEIETEDSTTSKSQELATKLHNSGRLTINLLISLLREGQVALAISCLGKLTGVSESFAKRALFDPWGDTLAIMLKAVAANKDHLTLIYRLTRNARAPEPHRGPDELQQLLALFESTTQATAGKMVQQWRRHPDYFAAIRQIQSSAT